MPITLPAPQLQIDFAFALVKIRELYLQQALGETVGKIDIKKLDAELAKLVPAISLNKLASKGLRGELMFAVPCLLSANPRLLGYYRLLLGYSQKAFYTSEFELSGFKSMEEKGTLSARQAEGLKGLCAALVGSATALLDGIGVDRITKELLDDLALLTIGPQLRGGRNVSLGLAGIVRVFDAISNIVAHTAVKLESNCIELKNAAGFKVLIEFSPDPDIIIRMEMAPDNYRNVLAIEIKGGMDFSNIHNRLGEAEKSHQKARSQEFRECWTVVNVDKMDLEMAHRESPSSDRFYLLSQIENKSTNEYLDFKNRIVSLAGISAS